MRYTKQEQKDMARELAYHVACEAQYRATAEKLDGKLNAKAIANAEHHKNKATYIRKELARA